MRWQNSGGNEWTFLNGKISLIDTELSMSRKERMLGKEISDLNAPSVEMTRVNISTSNQKKDGFFVSEMSNMQERIPIDF